jgi:hypothetical protein
MQIEKLVEPGRDARRRRFDGDASGRFFTLETADLAAQLVAVLARKRSEVRLPGLRQPQHWTSFFHHGRHRETRGRRQRRGGGDGGRGLGYRVELPHRGIGGARGQKRGPGLFLALAQDEQIQVVGDIGAACEHQPVGRGLDEGQQRHQLACAVGDPSQLEPAPPRKRCHPLALPGPGEER